MIKINVSKINRKVIKYSHWKLSCSEAIPQAFERNSAFAKESLVAQFSPQTMSVMQCCVEESILDCKS